jgi:hypothetical protein
MKAPQKIKAISLFPGNGVMVMCIKYLRRARNTPCEKHKNASPAKLDICQVQAGSLQCNFIFRDYGLRIFGTSMFHPVA